MHHLIMLAVIAGITLGTSGHSQTFAASYEAVSRGEVSKAVDLFATAVRSSLSDADQQERAKKGRDQFVISAR